MHTLALRTLRSATRSPARFIAHRRYPPSARIRHFHPSLTALNSSEGPSDPKDPSTNPQNDGATDTEPTSPNEAPEVVKTEESAEERNGKAKRESRNGYGSAVRRATRNRLKEIPPIVIPDWFLEKNVKLSEDCVRVIPDNFVECQYVFTEAETGEIRARLPILLRQEFVENENFEKVLEMLSVITFSGSDDTESALIHLHMNEFPSIHTVVLNLLQKAALEYPDGAPKDVFQPMFDLMSSWDPEKEVTRHIPEDTTRITQEHMRIMIEKAEKKAGKTIAQMPDDWEGVRPYPLVIGSYTSAKNSGQAIHLSFQLATHIRASINALLTTPTSQSTNIYADARSSLVLSASNPSYAFFLEGVVEHIASEVRADVITLEAQDFAELVADYVGDDPDEGLSGIRSLGYSIYKDRPRENETEKDEEATQEEDEDAEDADESGSTSVEAAKPAFHAQFIPLTSTNIQGISKTLERLGAMKGNSNQRTNGTNSDIFAPAGARRSPSNEQWDEMKLNALLDALMETGRSKRSNKSETSSDMPDHADKDVPSALPEAPMEEADRTKRDNESKNPSQASNHLDQAPSSDTSNPKHFQIADNDTLRLALECPAASSPKTPDVATDRSTIILVREFKELQSTPRGAQIISKLTDIIQHRRREGERIMLIGTTVRTEATSTAPTDVLGLDVVQTEMPYQEIFVPFAGSQSPHPKSMSARQQHIRAALNGGAPMVDTDLNFLERFEEQQKASVNFRHVKSMVKSLYSSQAALDDHTNSCAAFFRSLYGSYLPFSIVHDIVTTAMGIARTSSTPDKLSYAHLTLAFAVLEASHSFRQWSEEQGFKESEPKTPPKTSDDQSEHKVNIDALRKKCNKHERRLLPGVVNAAAIKTTFSSVHAPAETIEALKTLTSLSLIRPDAFTYGVLAADKIPGLLLYGPPGTGKTLLAKAVAKDSSATVLEVSGSEIYDMYVGEGEKNVRAIFSLARKLSKSGPCVVFIDEADAIFRSRGRDGRNSQREIINQFLREWDGMSERSVFVMVATNRPFDLDDAVLRRLPRRLLIDLPTEKDREAILRIHLEGETLSDDVSLATLASQTPFYSGSDLKNLCVSAALACVREENEAAKAATARDEDYTHAEKRTLRKEHFDKAMEEISASISEDMASLTAIRKFDEMYGDRRNRRKRGQLGFGDVDERVAERAARVRT